MKTEFYPPSKWKYWVSYAVHMRPYLLFISGIAGITGMAVGYQGDNIRIPDILAGIAFFLSYGFGQALTDVFQVDTDSISAAYRPLSKGIISKKHVFITSLTGLIICALLIILPNMNNLLFCTLSILGLATYSSIKRKYWWGGPPHNSWIVALLPIMGFLVASGGDLEDLLNSKLAMVVILNFFAYSNFVLIGYLKDITADRATGYRTFPVVFGWDKTVLISTIISLICILSCGALLDWSILPMLFFILASTFTILGNMLAWKQNEKTEANASIPIAMTVRSFILWNIAVTIQFVPGLLLPAILYFITFEAVLWKRPEQAQI